MRIRIIKPPISVPQLTPDERVWRVDWFGEFHYPAGYRNSQPSFRVAISPIVCDCSDQDALLKSTATNLNNQRQVSLKVGLLGLVKVGDLWQSGQCISSPKYQTEKFESLSINKTTTTTIKSGLSIDDKFILPLEQHPWHRLQTMSYCLNVALSNRKRIVIPCVELIRFYFGSSSKFLHLLFTRQISADDFWRSSNFDKSSRHLHLKLADDISGISAADIGRIALDNNAWRSARLVYDTCMVSSVAREPIYPYTAFPFVGETDLVCSGKWVSFGDEPIDTFVVYQIKSCSHAFPFKSLSYEVSDSKKVKTKGNKTASQKPSSDSKKEFINVPNISNQRIIDSDPGKSKSTSEHWTKGSPRFIDLTKKKVWRERYETQDSPDTILVKRDAVDEQVGVGSGQSTNKLIRGVDFTQCQNQSALSELDSKQHKFVYDGVKLIIQKLELQREKVTINLITPPGYTHPVISLPYLVDEYGEINPISICDDGHKGERIRRGCFLDVVETKNPAHRFFIVERKNIKDLVRIIPVREYVLLYAMEALVAYSKDNEKVISNNQKANSPIKNLKKFANNVSYLLDILKNVRVKR